MSSTFPPQAEPVRRERRTDPYTTIEVSAPAARRAYSRLRYGPDLNDPSAYRLPDHEHARLAACASRG
jgi:hypothetical protein